MGDAGPLPKVQTGFEPDSSLGDWIRPNPDYKIPNVTLRDPKNKKMRVITIGAGMSGIAMAYKIQEQMKNVEHQIYEKNAEIGGTWFENRYPGCACDIPAHAYTFPWAPNPEWPRFLAHSKDIKIYADRVVDTFGLRKYIKLNHQIAGCYWDPARAKWKVKIDVVEPKADWSSTAPLKVIDSFEDECDFLNHATGILNRWDYPQIEGIEKFRGRLVHTAGWPDDFGSEEWTGKRIAVIGSGASSVQTVPTMQPHAKHLDVFVRTPVWFVQIADNFGNNHEYSEADKKEFREHPDKLIAHIKSLENAFNISWNHNLVGSPEQLAMKDMVEKRMRTMITKDGLYEKITPTFPVNCRRITPGDPYMSAIQQENVAVHFTPAQEITADGVIGADGIERKVDAIVCATGFDVSYRPRFPVIGRNGVNLQDKWADAAEGYFGITCVDMPNWITFIGPNWPVAAGSIMGGLDANTDYALQMIRKLQDEAVKSVSPSQKAQDEFNEHTQTWAVGTVWNANCRSWYKDVATGRLRAVYPGSTLHFREMIKYVRWDDYDIEYEHKNRFAFMGVGRHMVQTDAREVEGLDASPYTQVENIDMRFLKQDTASAEQ